MGGSGGGGGGSGAEKAMTDLKRGVNLISIQIKPKTDAQESTLVSTRRQQVVLDETSFGDGRRVGRGRRRGLRMCVGWCFRDTWINLDVAVDAGNAAAAATLLREGRSSTSVSSEL